MNQFNFGLCLVVAVLALAGCGAQAGINDIRNRFRNMVSHENGGAAAASSAAAAGGYYNAAPEYYRPAAPKAPVYGVPPPVYGGGAAAAGAAAAGGYHYAQPQRVQAPYYAPAPAVHPPVPRVAPRFVKPASRFQAGAASSSAALGGGAAAAAGAAAGGHRGGRGGSAASSAAAAGRGGAAAAGAAAGAHSAHRPVVQNQHVVGNEEYDEHYNEPETVNSYGAQAGSYANDGKGLEQSSYVRNTESLEKHEDGKEDDDHYYNAQSYGKTFDENKHEAYNNDDEDIIHTPNVFRKKKSNTNYVSDYNKARRESGSGVLAHDKHSASYNKNKKKFNESVDQRYKKEGEGLVDTQDFSSESHVDDEDEERTDNHGLGDFVGVDGVHHAKRPAFNAQAAAASSTAGGSGAASGSSATAAGRR